MTLAINGAAPVRTRPFPAHVTIGEEEKRAVSQVMDSGVLSRFLGAYHEDFLGGPEVRANEAAWAQRFGSQHAISVNSNTSGLYCALGAVGIGPGDEVIVSPYSMSASAVCPLVWGATPIFADVETEHFCLDTASVAAAITDRTKAIVVVDLFGQPYDADGINTLARENGLRVIEDAAQAPGALYGNRPAGTLGDIGVFSLNYHKHIHCGEGGIILTDDDELAERMQLIRNHAESVVAGKGISDLTNMIGFNFRMTEIESAIARCQLEKLDALLEARLENVSYIEEKLSGLPGIVVPAVRHGTRHVYYQHVLLWDTEAADGLHRDDFVAAVKAELPHNELRENEGVKLAAGYVKPLYLLPMFAQRMAMGRNGFPLSDSPQTYAAGLCPAVERLHEEQLFAHEFMLPSMSKPDIDDAMRAFEKVCENLSSVPRTK